MDKMSLQSRTSSLLDTLRTHLCHSWDCTSPMFQAGTGPPWRSPPPCRNPAGAGKGSEVPCGQKNPAGHRPVPNGVVEASRQYCEKEGAG